jgi:hypothetical protein
MGTFAETANVGYRLSLANHGKQTSVSCFCLQQTNGSCRLPLVPFSAEQQRRQDKQQTEQISKKSEKVSRKLRSFPENRKCIQQTEQVSIKLKR